MAVQAARLVQATRGTMAVQVARVLLVALGTMAVQAVARTPAARERLVVLAPWKTRVAPVMPPKAAVQAHKRRAARVAERKPGILLLKAAQVRAVAAIQALAEPVVAGSMAAAA